MGILRDTYIVNKINTTGIEYQMRRKNDIQEQQNLILNNTKDRVDISLKEYESLKEELKKTKSILLAHENFLKDLALTIKQEPDVLLKSKVVKSEFERKPMTNSYNLYVLWEIKAEDLD